MSGASDSERSEVDEGERSEGQKAKGRARWSVQRESKGSAERGGVEGRKGKKGRLSLVDDLTALGGNVFGRCRFCAQ